MAELDLDALEQAAREAGGGCWFSTGWTVGSRGFEVGDLKSRDRICSDATERCAEFIAAANPATILELLDRLKAAEKRTAKLEERCAVDGIRWDLLPGWLIDHHEGAVLSEELLQRALAEMLAEMPKPEVQTALRERVMDAIAEALGDAYDCTRHWSAWGYGTMSQDDFSLVTDDSDRIGEIADAAIGVIGAQPATSVQDVPAKSLKPVIDWLRNDCDPMKAADELEILIAAAPEAKP